MVARIEVDMTVWQHKIIEPDTLVTKSRMPELYAAVLQVMSSLYFSETSYRKPKDPMTESSFYSFVRMGMFSLKDRHLYGYIRGGFTSVNPYSGYKPNPRPYFLNDDDMPVSKSPADVLASANCSISWYEDFLKVQELSYAVYLVLDYLKERAWVNLVEWISRNGTSTGSRPEWRDDWQVEPCAETYEELIGSILDTFAYVRDEFWPDNEGGNLMDNRYTGSWGSPTMPSPFVRVEYFFEEQAPMWVNGKEYTGWNDGGNCDFVSFLVEGAEIPTCFGCTDTHTASGSNDPESSGAPWSDAAGIWQSEGGYNYQSTHPVWMQLNIKQTYDVSDLPDELANSTEGILHFKGSLPSYGSFTEWENDTAYSSGQRVSCDGKIYRCIRGHTSSNDTRPPSPWYDASEQYWSSVEVTGLEAIEVPVYINDVLVGTVTPGVNWDDIEQTIEFNPQDFLPTTTLTVKYGWDDWDDIISAPSKNPSQASPDSWDEETPYSIGESVRHEGVNYVCISPSTGDEPPNELYWSVTSYGMPDADPCRSKDGNYNITGCIYKSLDYQGIYIKPVYTYNEAEE